MESESDKLRVKRRSAKGKFTRQMRTVEAMVLNERSHSEVYVNWQSLQQLYDELQDRHEAFCETIDPKDEAAYDEEDEWMEKCREMYVKVSMSMNDYIRSMDSNEPHMDKDRSVRKSDTTRTNDERRAAKSDIEDANKTEIGSAKNTEIGSAESSSQKQHIGDSECRVSMFKLEFSQMPKFSGDVREYAVFRSDFKDLIEPKCSKRDAITLLRNNLIGKPHELIKGMGNDYVAAWEFLDSVYGDPRVIADAVTYDITSFSPLKEDEDTQFCELCHLVRRSFNTLKDIGRQADLDNNHMLAIIEQKMSRDDRKIWSRKVEEGKVPATLERLLNWMTTEMKSRMRASALIRDGPQSTYTSRVNYVSNVGSSSRVPLNYKQSERCWICKSVSHWVDECGRFQSLTPTERMNMVKENHACYCCLKRTGKNHTTNTCYRRRQCMEHNGYGPCMEYHHPLLHIDECTERISNAGVVGVTGVVSANTILPIVDVYVLGELKKRKSANLLLDSGAQISLIRTQLAEELNLRGEDITIMVNKVGGNEDTLKTKRYDVCVQSVDRKHTTYMSAIGMPHITDDISLITNMSEKARQFKIPLHDIHRGSGSVDLLVGVNCPELHTGETAHYGNMIARKSPLGWIIFGTESPIYQSNQVLSLNVQVVNPTNGTRVSNTDTTHSEVRRCTHEKDYRNDVEKHKSKLKHISDDSNITGNNGRCYVPCNKSRTRKKHKAIENTPKANAECYIYHEEVPQMKDTKRDLAVTSVAILQTRNENTTYTRNLAATANRNAHVSNETCDQIYAVPEKSPRKTNAFPVMKQSISTAETKLKTMTTIMNVFLFIVMMILLIHPHGHGYRPTVSLPPVIRSEAVEGKVQGTYYISELCERRTRQVALFQEPKLINCGEYVCKVTTYDTDTVRENFLNGEELVVDEMYRNQEDQGSLKTGISKYGITGIRHCESSNDIQWLPIEPQKELRQVIRECDTVSIQRLCSDRQMDWRFITPQNGCTASFGTYLVNVQDLCQISNYCRHTSYMLHDSPYTTVSHRPLNESANSRHRLEFVEQCRKWSLCRWTRDVLPSLYAQKKWHVERRIRGHWQIVEMYPRSDEKIRNVKTLTGEYNRSATKIVVFYPTEVYDNESSGGPENESTNVKSTYAFN